MTEEQVKKEGDKGWRKREKESRGPGKQRKEEDKEWKGRKGRKSERGKERKHEKEK